MRPCVVTRVILEPINTVGNVMNGERSDCSPIRLCYHRGVHYNSIVDPQKATIGVGLGKCGPEPKRNTLGVGKSVPHLITCSVV